MKTIVVGSEHHRHSFAATQSINQAKPNKNNPHSPPPALMEYSAQDRLIDIIQSRIDELVATRDYYIHARDLGERIVVRTDELENLKKKLINNVDQELKEKTLTPEEIMYRRLLIGCTLPLLDLASPEHKSETKFTPDLLVKLPVDDPMLLLSENDFKFIHDLISSKLNSSYFLNMSIGVFIDHAESWLQRHTEPKGDAAKMVTANLNWIISSLDAKIKKRKEEEEKEKEKEKEEEEEEEDPNDLALALALQYEESKSDEKQEKSSILKNQVDFAVQPNSNTKSDEDSKSGEELYPVDPERFFGTDTDSNEDIEYDVEEESDEDIEYDVEEKSEEDIEYDVEQDMSSILKNQVDFAVQPNSNTKSDENSKSGEELYPVDPERFFGTDTDSDEDIEYDVEEESDEYIEYDAEQELRSIMLIQKYFAVQPNSKDTEFDEDIEYGEEQAL